VGGAAAPKDTDTTGTQAPDTQPEAVQAKGASAAAWAFGKEVVGPLVRGYIEDHTDPLMALGNWGAALRLAQRAKEGWDATRAAQKRGDNEGAAAEAGKRLPVSSGLLATAEAVDNAIDDWQAGNRDPTVIGRNWGRITVGGFQIVTGVVAVVGVVGAAGSVASAASLPEGSFSISDWSGYPEGVPKPTGPFVMLEGADYAAAREAANRVNAAMHRADPALRGMHIHEVQPVKFGGSPIDPSNKIALSPPVHWSVTSWWNQLARSFSGD
jgi:hypothetical protein